MKEKCCSSQVEPNAQVEVNGVKHSAALSHACKFDKGHDGKCECECNKTWEKWHNA